MLVGMVDDRALRFRQRNVSRAEPPNQTRTRRPAPRDDRDIQVSPYENQPTMDQAYNETFERTLNKPVVRPFTNAFADMFLPYSAPAAREGNLGLGDVAKDAASYAAGGVIGRGVTKGLQGAAPLFQQGQRTADPQFVESVAAFLGFPKTGYHGTLNKNVLKEGIEESGEVIPAGMELYRAPSAGQVAPSQFSQSVPLPRNAGEEFLPGRVQSYGSSADLNRLGALLRNLSDTGGNQWRNPALMKITAQEDIPGLPDLPGFLANNPIRLPAKLPTESEYLGEGLLGPATRFILRDYDPGNIPASLRSADGRLTKPLTQQEFGSYQVPTYYFDAFAR